MRTIDRLSPTSALARLRALVDRLRRSVMVRRPSVRWGLALAAALGLSAAGYWAATALSTTGVRYLASQRRFSTDDLIKVCRALDKGRVEYRVDEQRRVEVAADQFEQADLLVAKLDLGQHSIDEIRSESSIPSIFDWETPGEREQKKELRCERILERLIGQLDGVVWPLVSVHRPRSAAWQHPAPKPSAFVYIETDGNRKLSDKTVQSISEILAGYVPDLTPGSIRVMDRRGNKYLDPGDPGLGDSSRNRAREEELSEEIVEKLDWIKGVRVQVQVIGPRAPVAAVVRTGGNTASGEPGAPKHIVTSRPGNATPQSDSGGSRPTMVLNQPLALAPEPNSVTKPSSPGGPASALGSGSPLIPASAVQPDEREHERGGRVLVHVPRSYYYHVDIRTDDREPSREDLRVMAERTEKQIRTAVGLVIPESGSWKVDVDTIADEVSLFRPVVLPSASDPWRRFSDWRIVGAVGAAVSILAAVGSWILIIRRPAWLPEPVQKGRRYHADSASEPGPSERVRELIRSNPEAAASVLQRWVGQGGGVS